MSGEAFIRFESRPVHCSGWSVIPFTTYHTYTIYHTYQGSGHGWGTSFAEIDEGKDEDEVTTAEAEEEYKRVFAECLENNFDLDLATKTAKAAMRAALNIVDSEDEESEGDNDDEEDAEIEDLTRGITVIEPPRYFFLHFFDIKTSDLNSHSK